MLPVRARELARLAGLFGDEVVGTAGDGSPALDLPAAVRKALATADVELVAEAGVCTACSGAYFSHRARRDGSRHVLGVWLEDEA